MLYTYYIKINISSSCHASSMDFPDSPLLLAGLLGHILCLHRSAVDKFQLVVQYLCGHVKGSREAPHL